jgi:hypothetical protein
VCETTAERVHRLAAERPDLLFWLRQLLDRPDGSHDDVPQPVLDELVARGLIQRVL